MSQPILRVVLQRAQSDCAVAVLAMISGLGYDEVAAAFSRTHPSDSDEGYLLRDVIEAGKKIGVFLEIRSRGEYDLVLDSGILTLRTERRWHAVVLYRGLIFDTDGYVWGVAEYLQALKHENPSFGAMLIPTVEPKNQNQESASGPVGQAAASQERGSALGASPLLRMGA